jgi:hypothetical protein
VIKRSGFLLFTVLALLAVPVLADDEHDIEIIDAQGNPESCEEGVPVADLTVAYHIPGEIVLYGQAFTNLYNERLELGTTPGGGAEFNTVVDAPTVPENTLIYYTFADGEDHHKAGVAVNCTTGEVFPGGTLMRDGRFDAGDDMPILIYPQLDEFDQPYLEFYAVRRHDEGDERGRLLTRLTADVFAELPEEPERTIRVAMIGMDHSMLYLMADGNFQLHLAPDYEGKVKVVVFDGIQPTEITRLDFEVEPTCCTL